MPIPTSSPLRMEDAYCSVCLEKMKKEWQPKVGRGCVLYTCKKCGYTQSASPSYITVNGASHVAAKGGE